MRIPNSFLALPAVMFIAACGGDAAEDVVVEAPSVEQAAAPAPMSMPAMAMSARFDPLQDSGVGGEATVTGRGAETEVTVRLTGARAGATLAGHIHTGSCAAVGTVVIPLQPVTVDATGTGTMTATVAVPGNTAMNGQHVIVYHAEAGAEAPITCAPIPAHMM